MSKNVALTNCVCMVAKIFLTQQLIHQRSHKNCTTISTVNINTTISHMHVTQFI